MPTDHLLRSLYPIVCIECKEVAYYSVLEAVHQTRMRCKLCDEIMHGSDYYERPKAEELLKSLGYPHEHTSPNEVFKVDEAMKLDFQKAFMETR